MKYIKLNFCSFIRTLDKGMVLVLFTATKDFSCVRQGPIIGKIPYFFPNLIKKIPNRKINLRSYQYSQTSMARTPLGL